MHIIARVCIQIFFGGNTPGLLNVGGGDGSVDPCLGQSPHWHFSGYGPGYLTLNNIVTLKSGLEVTQDHPKWYHSKAWVRFPIHLP